MKKSILLANLLTSEVQQFIEQHAMDDVADLTLKYTGVNDVPIAVIADQIIGKRKAKEKLPFLYKNKSIVYPPGLNLEQSSSEVTGKFKSDLLGKMLQSKKRCVDLTGGFGVDSFFLSQVFETVDYIEPNSVLLEIAANNHRTLGATGINHHSGSAEDFLRSSQEAIDCIYIDPSRRDHNSKRVYSLTACEPDVSAILPTIFERTHHLLIKASSLLDIDQAVRELGSVAQIVVVAVSNECKELLFWCTKHYPGEHFIDAVNIKKDGKMDTFRFSPADEKLSIPEFSDPLNYLYEPNAAILKSGAFKVVATRFGVHKLHPSTHLYTSNDFKDNFPGRVFKVVEFVKADPKKLKMFFPSGQANITTRNYPLTVQDLRHKTGLTDGGKDFLIGLSGQQKKFLVVAERLY